MGNYQAGTWMVDFTNPAIDTQQDEIDQLKRWKTEWSTAAIR